MWPYIVTFIAVAVFPLALAGYGGHLATLALPENSQKRRRAIAIVWSLAIVGVLLFGAFQIISYFADKSRDAKDELFRGDVLGRLEKIQDEPDENKRKAAAAVLKTDVTAKDKTPSRRNPANPSPLVNVKIASQKQITSADPEMPYGLEIVVTTTKDIAPVVFNFIFSGDVERVRAIPVQGLFTEEQGGIVVSTPNVVFYQRHSPAFTPAIPMTFYVYSRSLSAIGL